MTDLPTNWVQTSLGDVCAILDSKRVPVNSKERQARTSGKPENELFPYYGATGQVDVIDAYLFEGEHVLLGEDGAPFLDPTRAKAYVVNGRFWVNNHAHILLAHGSNKYLSHYLNAVRYENHVTGTTRPKLTKRALASIPVALPPLNEQCRIVQRIETLFDEIDQGAQSLCDAKRAIGLYRQSLLKSAFEGRLTADWRVANTNELEGPKALLERIQRRRQDCYKAALLNWERAIRKWREGGGKGKRPAKPKARMLYSFDRSSLHLELPELPHGWTWSRLGGSSMGPEYGTAAKSSTSGAVPVVRMGNIQNGRIDWADLVYTTDSEEIARYSLKPGDVLFNRTNSPELVGKTGIYRGERPALFAGYLVRVNQINEIASGPYVAHFLNSPLAREHGKSVKTDGVNQSNINGTKLQEYPLPLCSVAEQAELVRILDAHLEAAEALDEEIDANLARAEALRQSILHRAFSGELVPQDPDDEPAQALLARIRASRGGNSSTKPGTRTRRRARAATRS